MTRTRKKEMRGNKPPHETELLAATAAGMMHTSSALLVCPSESMLVEVRSFLSETASINTGSSGMTDATRSMRAVPRLIPVGNIEEDADSRL